MSNGSKDLPATALPFTVTPTGLRLAVRLTPRAARGRIDGVVADADGRPLLQLRLRAPPVDGAANAALIAFLANLLALRRSDIAIRSGELSRVKILQLTGDGAAMAIRLQSLIASVGA